MKFDMLDQREILKYCLINGVPVSKNIDSFSFDKELYLKKLGNLIAKDLPFLSSWFCTRTECLIIDVNSFKEYSKIKIENNSLMILKGKNYDSYSNVFSLAILKIMLEYEGHIVKIKNETEDKDSVLSEDESTEDIDWI